MRGAGGSECSPKAWTSATTRCVTAPGATRCVWPSALSSLNLSFAGLEQVPKGLPTKLSVLDLSCNKLSREPRREELPEVNVLTLDGNPFLDPGALKHQDDPMISGVVPACARSALTMGVSGTLALLPGPRLHGVGGRAGRGMNWLRSPWLRRPSPGHLNQPAFCPILIKILNSRSVSFTQQMFTGHTAGQRIHYLKLSSSNLLETRTRFPP